MQASTSEQKVNVAGFPKRELLVRVGLTAVSGMVAEAATFPVDFTKTRMQLQGEGLRPGVGSLANKGVLGMALHVVNTEGPGGLFRGLSPAVARHVPYTGSRIVLYEQMRNCVATTSESGKEASLLWKIGLGASAGALAQVIAMPTDVVKVRMQADGRLVALGQLSKPRYSSLSQALAVIVKEEGGRGLFKGMTPAVQRAALVNLGELATYDQAKHTLLHSGMSEGVLTQTSAAVISGFVATCLSTPADVVKTRMMNQSTTSPLYNSSLDCIRKTFKVEGLTGMYKGFFPTWGRLGPWQLIFW
eukprot:CAMPEP_0196599036 /NCGR_PEP_ID=MMETSP1081-20130531/94644_1 /TAXON_ID=36882 /ORGANISM="Pyramimonas amylifera, Strain CCMP720" /LENGTH=302 /DNA_ID=CAMNT_0041924781 /DNA_START=25 /DNA_END=930 /DNA_ORIENTATION=+